MTKREYKYHALKRLKALKIKLVNMHDFEGASIVRLKERKLLGIKDSNPVAVLIGRPDIEAALNKGWILLDNVNKKMDALLLSLPPKGCEYAVGCDPYKK